MLTTSIICCRVRPNFTVTACDSFSTGLSEMIRLQNIPPILKIFQKASKFFTDTSISTNNVRVAAGLALGLV